ncbi:MAG: electron transport complex subunit E [Candidatus Pseudoscilispira sp.]|nr:electron transport complex subunit E [bacterium 210917-SL.2.15]MDY4036054.1 electron transport complex subunit E [Candidatus Pseudoscilispira sp.]
MNFGKQLKEGVITNNPVLVQILGMCPTLAVSTSLFNGIGMGICATLVLMCSNLVISLLRNIIPNKVRIAAFIVVIAGFVTCVDLLLKAFVPALSDSLGVFIPLIVVNCIILGRAEAFAYKNPPLASVVDGLTQGIGFTCALTILSVAREFLGSGTFGGGLIDVSNGFRIVLGGADGIRILPEGIGASLITQPAGGFLSLGIFIAIVTFLLKKSEEKAAKKEATK